MNPTISAILPTFNRAEVLPRAINSVLRQTYRNFELIIVCDGSKDLTHEVVNSFNDPRIKFVQHTTNQGASLARNTGILMAKGKYIAFLDSDDEWLPNKLARQFELMERAADTVALCCTGIILHWTNSQLFEVRPLSKKFNNKKNLLSGCRISPGTTLMLRKSSLEHIGLFDSEQFRLEDWEWLLRFVKSKYEMEVISEPLAIVHLGIWPSADVVCQALNKMRNYILLQDWSPLELRHLLCTIDIEMAAAYWRGGLKQQGFIALLRTMLRFPIRVTQFLLNAFWRRIRRKYYQYFPPVISS